ncbi:MAG: DUF4232 domain-containing protein [Acidimicrobiales bacterium]
MFTGRGLKVALLVVAVTPAGVAASFLTLAASAANRSVPVVGCQSAVLSGTFYQVEGSSAMGHVEYSLRLTNSSSQTCTMAGLPSLQLLDKGGKPLPTDVTPWQPRPAATAVTLGPGMSATATALVAVDIPGRGDTQRPGVPCQPAAVNLRVSAAGKTSFLVAIGPPTSVCQSGAISFKAYVVQHPVDANPTGLVPMIHNLLGAPPREYTLKLRYDPNDRSWVEWSFGSAGPADNIQGGVAFAHLVAGTWRNLWGPGNPAFCELGGAPTSVPATVLRAFGITCSAH